MQTSFCIGERRIGKDSPTFIVAEIGANHNGDVDLAKKEIDAAAACGVDAVKFQSYTAEELVSDTTRVIEWGPEGRKVREPVGEMFDRIALPRDKHREVFDYANKLGLIAFSTPFSVEGAKFLDALEVPCFKVAASDVNYQDMLSYLATTGKPILLSAGKCTLGELDEAVVLLEQEGCKELVVMHCVSNYPSAMEDMNLKIIPSLGRMYEEDAVIGFSDHSMGITASLGAVAMGAKVIEKHFTLDKNLVGPDHWFSMDPKDMQVLVSEIRNLESAMGHPRKRLLESEQNERNTSIRSIVAKRFLHAGTIITRECLKTVRPGGGISPFEVKKILGMRLEKDVPVNGLLTWDAFRTY